MFDILDWPSSILKSGPPPIKPKPTLPWRNRWWRRSAKEKSHCGVIRRDRREYEFGAGSIQGVARKLGVHRRLVREALSSAVPVRKPAPKRKRPRVGPVMDFIDAILEEDRKAPRKQRHTAHRIYVRLCREQPNWPLNIRLHGNDQKAVKDNKPQPGLDDLTPYLYQL